MAAPALSLSHALGLQDLSYKDRHWHEACFHCSRCKSSLVDKPFAAKEDQLLCMDCYSHQYSSKCQECKETIMPGQERALLPRYASQQACPFLPFPWLNLSESGHCSNGHGAPLCTRRWAGGRVLAKQ